MATARLIGTGTQGDTNIGNNSFSLAKFTAEGTGKVTEIQVYSLASGNIKVAIYADDSGEPGALLGANNTSQAVTASQWNTVTIPETEIVSGTVYWLAFNSNVSGVVTRSSGSGTRRSIAATYSSFTFPDPAGSGFTPATNLAAIAGWGVLTLKPSGVEQAIAIGTPTVQLGGGGLTIQPSGIAQEIALGTPIIQQAGGTQTLLPAGIAQGMAYGTPALIYPQTLSPGGIAQTIVFGTPSVGFAGIISPSGIEQLIAIGTPAVLRYVWHVILDGQYATETPETNRAYVIGRDINGNPVYGTAIDSTELGLVGERLDFRQELSVPTDSKAADVADAILKKMRLTTKRGVILIPPNCGQELWDVVEINDSLGNQSAQKFRVVGIRFEYHPREARYYHKLILGAP